MSLRVLIVPDKFKGTLDAPSAAKAIARGWQRGRPEDKLTLLPMSDGGDGFGEVISRLIGAKKRTVKTANAAHKKIFATWWWEAKSKTAVIESAQVIGLAMLPPMKYHPFKLDTFGLGAILQAAHKAGAKRCVIGIGGSATNDGGSGLAQALGWTFWECDCPPEFLEETMSSPVELLPDQWMLHYWPALVFLDYIKPPTDKMLFPELIVAVDVQNPLLGKRGCSAVYGPQKGLLPKDIAAADQALARLAQITERTLKKDFSNIPGAGAAGGLGFGLMAFAGAKPESGFELFAHYARLQEKIRAADLIITGEGALDAQTLMGKGVGQVAQLCKKLRKPCIGLAGIVTEPRKANKLFTLTRSLVELTDVQTAKKKTKRFLADLSAEVAISFAGL